MTHTIEQLQETLKEFNYMFKNDLKVSDLRKIDIETIRTLIDEAISKVETVSRVNESAAMTCPFCGGEAETWIANEKEPDTECATCPDPDCVGSQVRTSIYDWNTRAQEPNTVIVPHIIGLKEAYNIDCSNSQLQYKDELCVYMKKYGNSDFYEPLRKAVRFVLENQGKLAEQEQAVDVDDTFWQDKITEIWKEYMPRGYDDVLGFIIRAINTRAEP